MRVLHRALASMRAWTMPGREDRQLADELRFHLDREVQANRDAGMTEAEALRAARLAFGSPDVIREAARDERPGEGLRQFAGDLRYGWRLFRRAPGFAVASVLILALGIASTTAVFSVLYGVVLRPLPYRDPARLVSIWTRLQPFGGQRAFVNAADYSDWRATATAFEDIALVRHIANFNLVGSGEPERLFGARISPNLLSVLGVSPAIGHPFDADADTNGRDRVVLLSDSLWRRRFAADPGVVGRTIVLSGVPHTVVGVMGPEFRYPGREYQLWVPLTINPHELSREEPGFNYLSVGRLKTGVSLERAQAEMDAVAAQLSSSHPATNRGVQFRLAPLRDDTVAGARTALWAVFAATICLLLVSSLNLAGLLTARAVSRRREFAIRAALGAPRGRLARQGLAEVLPTLVLGGAFGLMAAAWAVGAFVPLAPATLPRVENVALDWHVLLFSLAMLGATGAAVGILPMFRAARARAVDPRAIRSRSRFVVVQMALTLPLLVAAMLLTRSFISVASVDPGFRPANVVSFNVAIPRSRYQTDAQVAAFCQQIVERVSAIDGVRAAGMVNRLPLGGVAQTLLMEFDDRPDRAVPLDVDSRSATPDYFRAMGIPLMAGRTLTDRDVATVPLPDLGNAPFPASAIIDDQLARKLWPDGTAVGHHLRIALPHAPWVEIVGVVGHIRHDGLDVDPRPQVYFNSLQRPQDRMALVVRSDAPPPAVMSRVVEAIHDLDPEQPVYDVRTMDDVVSASIADRWMAMALIALLAAAALALAAVGLYGSVSYGVAGRTREFGIRMAIGATRRMVVLLVTASGLRLAASGVVIGLMAAVLTGQSIRRLLFGVQPLDAGSFAVAVLALAAVVLVASLVPAWRAASVDPATALRVD